MINAVETKNWNTIKLLRNENARIGHYVRTNIIFDVIIFATINSKAIGAPRDLDRIESKHIVCINRIAFGGPRSQRIIACVAEM